MKILIIGAGPAGMMAAITAAKAGSEVKKMRKLERNSLLQEKADVM